MSAFQTHWGQVFLVIVTVFAACIETDIYLPAFADMMHVFQVSEDQIQSTLTWNFLGLCVSGPFYGPLSDSLGRKKPLMIALTLFFFGSLLTIFAQSFDVMLVGRVLQGLGAGGCFTLGTAILFDLFDEKQAIRAMSHLNTAIPVLMAGAPLLGGILTTLWGFRANFVVIGFSVSVSLVIVVLGFKESLAQDQRIPFSLPAIGAGFSRALHNRSFWKLALIVSFFFTSYILFVSSTAVLFVVELGVDPQKSPFYQLALLGSYVLASLLVAPVSRCFAVDRLQKIGLWLIGCGAFGLILVTVLAPQHSILLTVPMMIHAFGCSWAQIPYWNAAMFLMPEIKGIIASLLTSFRLLIAAGTISLVSTFYNKSIIPITCGVSLAVLIGFFFARAYHVQRKQKNVL